MDTVPLTRVGLCRFSTRSQQLRIHAVANLFDPSEAQKTSPWTGPPVALLWDQSLVWGLVLVEALEAMAVPYRLVTAQHIRAQGLQKHRVLMVPGGWASHKARALGADGLEQVRTFVQNGGGYVGFCGGAGLALAGASSLNLVPIHRKGLTQRLPNASGEVWIEGNPEHPLWKDLPPRIPVSIWWPSQFAWDNGLGVEAVARYRGYGEDFWVADLCAADVTRCGARWQDWEKGYGINLNPALLEGQAAILCCRVGKGMAVLSYPHLELPDGWGRRLLANILNSLQNSCYPKAVEPPESLLAPPAPGTPLLCSAEDVSTSRMPLETLEQDGHDGIVPAPSVPALRALQEALEEAQSLIAFGERHLLWRWRRPWLLQWQRGIRGLEYGFLLVCLRFVVSHCGREKLQARASTPWDDLSQSLLEQTRLFCREARKLLLYEKVASHQGPLHKLQPVNAQVDALRETLFGRGMSHTGLSQHIFDTLDALVYCTLVRRRLGDDAPGNFWMERCAKPPKHRRA